MGRLTPLASPVTRFTFDSGFKPLTRPSSLRKPGLNQSVSPSKSRKHVRLSGVTQKIFYPVAQLYHLDSWPSYLRLLSPAHLLFLFLISLSTGIGGCIAYPLGCRIVAMMLWLVSFLVSVLVVLGMA